VTVDPDVFRAAIGHFMSGVVVLTTVEDGIRHGMTVSAITSLSIEPPMLLACLNSRSRTQQAVERSQVFAVNILAEDQGGVAGRFASPAESDRFAGLDVRTGVTGAPLLDGALAVVECRVAQMLPGGSHRVFLADVVAVQDREGAPLAYFRGGFGRIELARDADAYRRLREVVLSRSIAPDEALDVDELAGTLGVPGSSVYHALTRLTDEGLVRLDPDQGHVLTALDADTSDDVHDARLAIELGAAELTVGRLEEHQLARIARLADLTVEHLRSDRATDVDAYIRSNLDFHAYLVACAGSEALDAAHERLSMLDLMNRALRVSPELSPHLARDHVDLAGAYARGDLPAVRAIAVRHAERAKAVQRAGIEHSGTRGAGR
jgi:4-nitrophenol 2-monooxygenase / 4-nitrocatechol 4-monooxygenase, reductase component